MTPEKRRAVAFIAAQLIFPSQSDCIFDYSAFASHFFNFMQNKNDFINIYDISRNSHLTVEFSDNKGKIFDIETDKHINIEIFDIEFKGKDEESGHFFRGTVEEYTVSFFDNETEEHYDFELSGGDD